MRSFRAENLSKLIHHVLDRNVIDAQRLYHEIKEKYPIVLTRNLDTENNGWRQKREVRSVMALWYRRRLQTETVGVRCAVESRC